MVQTFGYQYIKTFDTNICMSKYNQEILKLLSRRDIKSTNEILKELEEATGKSINWHALYRILMNLQAEGKVERLKSKAGIFWRKI